MKFVPIVLRLLLHHIIPGIDFFFLKIIHKIERCARKMKDFCVFFAAFCNHIFTKFSLSSLVCLVNYYKIPVDIENFFVLIIFSANDFRTTHILNACKIDKVKIAHSVFLRGIHPFIKFYLV